MTNLVYFQTKSSQNVPNHPTFPHTNPLTSPPQALSIGVEVLNATDALLAEENSKTNTGCHDALLKMTHCPKCMGLSGSAKPCSGYCLNVLRGCLTKYVAELDSPWNGYVEGVERLVNAVKQHNNEAGVNADAVLRGLDTRISEAIMYAMGKEKEIENRVSDF